MRLMRMKGISSDTCRLQSGRNLEQMLRDPQAEEWVFPGGNRDAGNRDRETPSPAGFPRIYSDEFFSLDPDVCMLRWEKVGCRFL